MVRFFSMLRFPGWVRDLSGWLLLLLWYSLFARLSRVLIYDIPLGVPLALLPWLYIARLQFDILERICADRDLCSDDMRDDFSS